jgi:hypothetical protein
MPGSEPSRWYPSKVDAWIAAVLLVAPVVTLGAGFAALSAGAGVVGFAGFFFMLAIYFGLVWPMRYGITDEVIVVRHGLIRQRIKLADITEVRPTRSPLSAPALSLDRIAIRFGEGMFKSAMLSPADQSGFLAELAQRAGLVREGDALVRRK